MAMIKCPKCNEDVSDRSTKCVHCGHVLIEEPKLFCEECGNEIKKSDKACSKCGCPIDKKQEPQKVEVTKVKIGNGISKKKNCNWNCCTYINCWWYIWIYSNKE